MHTFWAECVVTPEIFHAPELMDVYRKSNYLFDPRNSGNFTRRRSFCGPGNPRTVRFLRKCSQQENFRFLHKTGVEVN